MLDHVAKILGRQTQVHLEHHCGETRNRPVQLEMTPAVPIKNAHPIGWSDAEAPQHIGPPANSLITVRISVAIPPAVCSAEHDLLITVGPRCVPDQSGRIQLGVIAHRGWAAWDDLPIYSWFSPSWHRPACSAIWGKTGSLRLRVKTTQMTDNRHPA